MCAPGQHGKSDDVGVFLQRGIDDLFGSLAQTGVDDFESGIAESAGNDFRAAVMPIEAGLGDKHADLFIHQNSRFLVDAVDGAKLVADFAECGIGANAIENVRHHVDGARPSAALRNAFRASRTRPLSRVCAQLPQLFDLPLGDGFVDQEDVDRRFALP